LSAVSSPAQCSNLACRVAETGKCVEGLTFDVCSHYGRPPEALDSSNGDTGVRPRKSDSVLLPAATLLSESTAAEILRAGDSRVIAVVGPTDAGKTSLIAGVYDLFQQGPTNATHFARSQSLHAFEQACHDARAASMRAEPHINRTPIGGVTFYHLEIGHHSCFGRHLSLLLADRAGEEYRLAADDPALSAGYSEVVRADTLTVLVDGHRLLDSGARHNVRSEVELILQALIDGEACQSSQRIALVLTKLDEVASSQHGARAQADYAALLASVRRLYGNAFSAIEPFQTAASPKSNIVPRGAGLEELISFWLGSGSQPPPGKGTQQPYLGDRAIARMTILP